MSDLGKAYVQIVPSAEGISGSISSILDSEATSAGKSAGLNLAGGIGGALKGATSLVAAGTVAMTGAITKGASEVASYGDNIDKLSQKMGISRQGYQEWEAVMQHSGTSMETMKSSMKTLANAVEKGNVSFERIGISIDDLSKMSNEEIFAATIAGLQNVDNETERTYLAGQLLGKGATELGALLNTSAEDTQAMKDRVHELGGVMSDDAVLAAAAFQDNMQDLQTAISGVGRGMISELLPSMNDILSGFTELITGGDNATELLSSGFGSLFDSLGGIAENIIGTITEMLPTIIQEISNILPELISLATDLIVSLADALVKALPTLLTTVVPALAKSAVEIITSLGKALIEAGPALLETGKQLFEMLVSSIKDGNLLGKGQEAIGEILNGITEALPGILESGVEIVTNLVNGLMESLPSLIETAGNMFETFVNFWMDNMPTIMDTGIKLLMNLVDGMVNNLPKIVDATVKVLTKLLTTVTENLPKILKAGVSLLVELTKGLIQAIPKLVAAIPQIVGAIFEAFASVNWLEIGVEIIAGIIEGLASALSMLVDEAVRVAKAAFDAAKSFLGISSPSKQFMFVGRMVDEGFAQGIDKNASLVTDAIDDLSNSSIGQMSAAASTNYNVSTIDARNDKMDVLLDILTEYLPEIAEKKGIGAKDLYNGLNRQLGWALT